MTLDEMLAKIAAEDAQAAPPHSIESRVLREFDGPAKPVRSWIPAWTAAAAACVAAAAIALRQPPPVPAAERPFLPVPYTAPPATYERTSVVRMDVPVAALVAAGFEVHAPDAGGEIQADVLFGQDGRALAVRIVPDSERRISQ